MIMSKFNWTIDKIRDLTLPTYIELQKQMMEEAREAKRNAPKKGSMRRPGHGR